MAFLRAVEAGDLAEQQRIAAEKQALRDLTRDPRLDSAGSPGELAVILPGGGP